MPGKRVLVLAGTRDGRELADALISEGFDVMTSLAGVTDQPALPRGSLRMSGFGGVEGLRAFIHGEGIDAVADATHPFAITISANARAAADLEGVPYVKVERPPWTRGPDDRWTTVASLPEAVNILPSGAIALATIGRKYIGTFFARPDISGVARMIQKPLVEPPPNWRVVLARPPFGLDEEKSLMREFGITHLVSKNSGGNEGLAKLIAARQLGIAVVLIDRPPQESAPNFPTVNEVVLWLRETLLP